MRSLPPRLCAGSWTRSLSPTWTSTASRSGAWAATSWTYARENTISYNAPKAFYATALRLKGFYLKQGTSTYTEKTYTYYIRHADPNNTNAEAVPMKYGIVRNNVYRISINRVNSLGVMVIETKDWITKELPPIYM